MKVLVTGAAGFIGSSLCLDLLKRGDEVLGIDNFNSFYSPAQKENNAERLAGFNNFQLKRIDFTDKQAVAEVFSKFQPEVVAHLGAMANVRHSIKHPQDFIDVNISGTNNLLDCSKADVENFVFASTGSIYGSRTDVPFKEEDVADRPLAAYPASKKSAELLGHAYQNLYNLNFTSLRFFNVYGPHGRPDMMPFKVAEALFHDKEIPVFGDGSMERDWTYVDDIVSGFVAAIDKPLGYEIINLGRGNPVALNDFLKVMEKITGKTARINRVETPESEVPRTFADISKAKELLGFNPKVDLEDGLNEFLNWFRAK